MTLTHTPAHTADFPDRFEDDETGTAYSVRQEDSAEDPRTWISSEHAAVFTYRAPRGETDTAPDNVAAQAFARYWESEGEERSLELTKRYLAAFHPEKQISVAISTVRGYSQGDWRDVFAAVAEGYGTPESHIDVFRMWAFGDVWVVIPDGKFGISGIYADDTETALRYYRENFEDKSHFFDVSLDLKIEAVSLDQARAKAQQIVSAIHDSDALPSGIRGSVADQKE